MRILAFVLLSLASTGAHAAAREKLDVFSRDIQGLSANFSQRVFDSRGVLKETSSGKVQLQAPRPIEEAIPGLVTAILAR
mgnify:CR=1 FL=1